MCNRESVSAAILNDMPSRLREELAEAFERHPRLKKYFSDGHFLALYVALRHEGLSELRDRLAAHIVSLQEV